MFKENYKLLWSSAKLLDVRLIYKNQWLSYIPSHYMKYPPLAITTNLKIPRHKSCTRSL